MVQSIFLFFLLMLYVFFCLNRQLICNLNNTIESNQSVNLSLFHSHGDFSWTIFCACWTILYFCLVYFICFYAYVCMYAWLKHARPSVIILQRDSISYYYYVYFVRKKPFETEIHIFFLEFDQMKKVSFRIEVFSLVFSFQQWKMTFFLFQKCSHFDGKLLITLWSSNLSFQFYHQKSNWNGSRLLKFIDDRRTDAIKIEIRKKSRENLLRLSS